MGIIYSIKDEGGRWRGGGKRGENEVLKMVRKLEVYFLGICFM